MGGGSHPAGPYERLIEWLADDVRFKALAFTAEILRIDPAIMATETSPRLNAVRYAAADVIATAKREAQDKASKK